MPIDEFRKLDLQAKIMPADVGSRSYTGEIIPAQGKAYVNIEYSGRNIRGALFLVPPHHATLLGRTWIRGLKVNLSELDEHRINNNPDDVNSIQVEETDMLLTEYADLFQEKIGCIPNVEIDLELRQNTAPRRVSPENVALLIHYVRRLKAS